MSNVKQRILVVDDDPRNVDILVHLLDEVAEIDTAFSGEECLEKTNRTRPDLILLDIMMPGMNGYDACSEIKAIKDGPKVILVSAKAMLEERLQGYEVGADDYVAKPFDHEEMVAKVRVFLKLKAAEDQLVGVNASLEKMVWARTEQLVGAEAESRRARAELDNVVRSMVDPMIVVDSDLKIMQCNPATAQVLQFEPAELVGEHVSKLLASSEVVGASGLGEVVRDGEGRTAELELMARNGTGVPVLMSASGLFDENGMLKGAVFVAKDLRERKRAEREKEVMHRQVQHASKLASIGELAAGVAHEINNPLTIIKGNMDLLHELFPAESGKKKVTDAFGQMDAAIERVIVIVNGLRVYARMDNSTMQPLNVHQILEQSAALVQHIFGKQNVTIHTNLKAKAAAVAGNTGRLQQVLMNLLSNARDAVEGVKNPEIRISTEVRGGELVLEVADNGCGMSESQRERIFEPFFTTKEAGRGTGLGLSISTSIIGEMKGRIEVASSPGKGTTFSVILPLLKPEEISRAISAQAAAAAPKAAAIKGSFTGRALVVDDERDICEILARYLSDLGFQVEMAGDGEEALGKLKKSTFDLLVTDMKMPKMCGDILVGEAKRMGFKDTRVVAVTGSPGMGDGGERIERFQEAVDGFVRKPFSRKELQEVVAEVMSG